MNAIKPVYDRKTKTYTVEHRVIEPADAIAAVNSGFYVTDAPVASVLGRVVAEKCPWYALLNEKQQKAVYAWLVENTR